MSNMSYCRFENTTSDLQDCVDALDMGELDELSRDELRAAKRMVKLCHQILRFEDDIVDQELPES